MAASVLSVRVDSSIKDSFAELCEELGMTSSVAVNMFMRQMLRERSLPFVPSLGKNSASENVAADILDIAQIESRRPRGGQLDSRHQNRDSFWLVCSWRGACR